MEGRPSKIVKLSVPASRRQANDQAGPPILPSSAAPNVSSRAAKPPAAPRTTFGFTQSQLALALTISKSKPESLTTLEYCQQLRRRIKTGNTVPAADLRYVDTCEFWKDQYAKIYADKKALEDKIHRLEGAQRTHRAHVRDAISDEDEELDRPNSNSRDTSRWSKRPITGNPRKRLAPNQQMGGIDEPNGGVDMFESDDLLSLSSYILRIARQRKQLESASVESGNLEQLNILSKQITQTLALLNRSLTDSCLSIQFLRANSDSQNLQVFRQLMPQIQLSYLSCFNALDELCRTIPGRAKKSAVVYRMAVFFNNSLKLLQTIAVHQSEREANQARSSRQKRERSQKTEYAVNKYLTRALASIVSEIEWRSDQPCHGELLEAMLFSILEQTGRLVSEAVFGEHVASSDNPGNITRDSSSYLDVAPRFEHRYIVQILHAAFGRPERRELITQVLSAAKATSNAQSHPSRSTRSSAKTGDLLHNMKKLLQSTLVRSTVGGTDLEILKLPPAPVDEADDDLQVTEVKKYGSEWLLDNVWALVGWDMIA